MGLKEINEKAKELRNEKPELSWNEAQKLAAKKLKSDDSKAEEKTVVPAGTEKVVCECGNQMTRNNQKYECTKCWAWKPVQSETKKQRIARLKKELADAQK